MARRLRRSIILTSLVGAGMALLHRRPREPGVPSAGGVLIADARRFDRLTGWLLRSFYDGVARDVTAATGAGARVLDVGCGPGHLLERLAHRGCDVVGVDLDAAMIERARVRLGPGAQLEAADVAALPFADASFDLVVSTISMHHWADQRAGLAEIARVVRPEGRVLIFDFAGAHVPLHGRVDGPAHHVAGSGLALVGETRWRWPGPISLVRRVEARPRPA